MFVIWIKISPDLHKLYCNFEFPKQLRLYHVSMRFIVKSLLSSSYLMQRMIRFAKPTRGYTQLKKAGTFHCAHRYNKYDSKEEGNFMFFAQFNIFWYNISFIDPLLRVIGTLSFLITSGNISPSLQVYK